MSKSRCLRPSVVATASIAVVVAAFGVVSFVRSVEADLLERVGVRAAEVAPLVASITVTGQDVTVTCSEPVLDVATLEASLTLRGVRRVEADRSCRSSRAPIVDPALTPTTTAVDEPLTTPDGVVVATTVPPTTVEPSTVTTVIADVLAAETSLSLIAGLLELSEVLDELAGDGPFVLFAPSDEAFARVDADVVASLGQDADSARRLVSRHLVDARLDPAAIGSDDADSVVLAARDGSATLLDPGETPLVEEVASVVSVIEADNGVVLIIDRVLIAEVDGVPDLVITWSPDGFSVVGAVSDDDSAETLFRLIGASPEVDAASTIDADTLDGLSALLTAIPEALVEGTLVIESDRASLVGTYRDVDLGEALAAVALARGVDTDLAAPPPVGVDDGVRVATAIDDLLLAEPIIFGSEGTDIDEASEPTLDAIARLLEEVPTAFVEVRGHTDSDGVEGSNILLSRGRAESVVSALIDRGLEQSQFVAVGVGSAEPVLIDGVEDKGLSRRVEFVVTVP